MELIVHIGTHKTGTTSIQRYLRENSAELAAVGVYVPVAGCHHSKSGHHHIAWDIRGDPRYVPERGGLEALISELAEVTQPRAVISAEDLEYIADRPDLLARFDQRLEAEGHKPRYVLFVRQPDTYAQSLYAELLDHGLEATFAEFLQEIMETGKYVMNGDWTYYFDSEQLVAKWRAGTEFPLHVLSYERAKKVAGGVVPTFAQLMGLPDHLVKRAHAADVLNKRKKASIPLTLRWSASRALRSKYGIAPDSAILGVH